VASSFLLQAPSAETRTTAVTAVMILRIDFPL
jgi:hypothetical protein